MPISLLEAARIARSQGRRPLVTVAEVDGWVIETWRESNRGWLPELAAVELRVDVVRLVVADPAENTLLADAHAHSARAVTAVWDHSRRCDSPAAALKGASAAVRDPRLRPRHRNPLAAAAVVDLAADRPHLLGGAWCADGDLWVRTGGAEFRAWSGADMLTAEGRARFEAASATAGAGSAQWRAQEEVIDDPSMWNHPSVGLVEDPSVGTFAGCDATDVVLTTDGARLEPGAESVGRVERLGEWLATGITQVGDDWPHPHPFGDLGVIRARWLG